MRWSFILESLKNCPIASKPLNKRLHLCVSLSPDSPSYIFFPTKQQVKVSLFVYVSAANSRAEQSAKCYLSTCALMINTILIVSINFLLHHQKAAVALSLSRPGTCFRKPFCGSCQLEIVTPLMSSSNTILQTDVQNAHKCNHTLVSYENTHAGYYTLLGFSHFTRLHTSKQIKCNSFFLLNHF